MILCFFQFKCGAPETKDVVLTGSVDITAAENTNGPVFLALLSTDDFQKLESNPIESIRKVIQVEKDVPFSINLSEMGLYAGEQIYITAFIDNDYNGGIPFPTEGDYAGFYINENWQTSIILKEGENNVTLSTNRRVYNYDARLRGTLTDTEAGTYFIIAYAGDIISMSPKALDINGIVGYKRIIKPAGAYEFELRILPYGFNVPIEMLHILALHDANGNGIPDAGDRIGFYTEDPSGIPTMITVNEGVTNNIAIAMQAKIAQPSGKAISLTGNFTKPAGYDATSKPVFVIIAKAENIEKLFTNPFECIKEFRRLTPGENSFTIDVSFTDLIPGDKVIVLALWDKDFKGGFPNPTTGDKIGLYQNTNVNNYQYAIALKEGSNTVVPSGDWRFDINKIMYPYKTSVEFKIDPNGRPSGMDEAHNLIAITVHENGVGTCYAIDDVNYILAMGILPYKNDSEYIYRFNIFPALDDRITNTTSMPTYIYVLYDRDTSGMPSSGDDIAAYWETLAFWKVPRIWNLISDQVNVLSAPNNDPKNPYAVRFLGRTY